jgi:hypothetical protein
MTNQRVDPLCKVPLTTGGVLYNGHPWLPSRFKVFIIIVLESGLIELPPSEAHKNTPDSASSIVVGIGSHDRTSSCVPNQK